MCYVCCKELKGWCKSFTRTEGLLSILEAVLFVVLTSFLVFLILHFVACRKNPEIATEKAPEQHSPASFVTTTSTTAFAIVTSTLSPDVECTWEPSQQTSAGTRYYLNDIHISHSESETTPYTNDKFTTTETLEIFGESLEPSHEYDDVDFLEHSDGEIAEDRYKSQVVALVKLKPLGDMTFGCILTKITKFWTLTAASCIESIEEVDSLDSFVIVEELGEARAWPRAVAAVRLHPRYGGRSRAHDVAALRSQHALRARAPPLRLPRLLDYFLVAVGERFLILGFGGYRTVDRSPTGRRVRQVSVYAVSGAACGADRAEQWAPRHLARGGAALPGACGAAPLCAGAPPPGAAPCLYCAGTPLLRDGTLFGVMSDNSACAVACEPQLYVNIATVRDWIDSVIE